MRPACAWAATAAILVRSWEVAIPGGFQTGRILRGICNDCCQPPTFPVVSELPIAQPFEAFRRETTPYGCDTGKYAVRRKS